MKKVVIIQTRMASTWLPGKVLMLLAEKPVLVNIVERIQKGRLVDQIVIATSVELLDDKVEAMCIKEGIDCFHGAQDNVLERFFQCGRKYNADLIIRMTGDNPLVDSLLLMC